MRRLVWGLLLGSTAFAAEYCAGVGKFANVTVLAIRRGDTEPIVLVDAGGLPRGIEDAATASAGLARAQIVFLGTERQGEPTGLATAIGAALGDCRPVTLSVGKGLSINGSVNAQLTVTSEGKASLQLETGQPGSAIHGPIRSVFRLIERPPELHTREAVEPSTFMQVVRFGKDLTLAVVGEPPSADLARLSRGIRGPEPLLVIAGRTEPLPPDLHDGLAPTLRAILRRVGRKP